MPQRQFSPMNSGTLFGLTNLSERTAHNDCKTRPRVIPVATALGNAAVVLVLPIRMAMDAVLAEYARQSFGTLWWMPCVSEVAE